ncbi:MAG: hypothetical protein PHR86_00590 [Desulfobacterales bacterium]|nr:hypothetical protein [Desulfobacterales bacterium]
MRKEHLKTNPCIRQFNGIFLPTVPELPAFHMKTWPDKPPQDVRGNPICFQHRFLVGSNGIKDFARKSIRAPKIESVGGIVPDL